MSLDVRGNTVTPINVSQSILIIISSRASQFWPRLTRHVIPCGAGQPGPFPRTSTMIYIFTSEHSNRVITITRAAASVAAAQEIIQSPDWEYLCVEVNNFPSLLQICPFVTRSEGPWQADVSQRCSPVCLLTVVWKSMWWSGFVFMMFGSERAPAICYWGQSARLYPEREIGVQRPVNGGWG